MIVAEKRDANPLAPRSSPKVTFGLIVGAGLANTFSNAAASSESIRDNPLAHEQIASTFDGGPAEATASLMFPTAISRPVAIHRRATSSGWTPLTTEIAPRIPK